MLGPIILTREPAPLSYYDSAVEAGQKDRYLQISSFLSGVAEVTRRLGTVVAGFFIHGALAWTYLIAIGLSFLSIILIYFMKEPMAKREKNEALTFKTIVLQVRKEWQEKPVLFYWMMTYASRNTHVHVLLLLSAENK